MNIAKSIQLTTSSLEQIIRDGESIDFRLDDDAWKELQVGDYIEFWEDFTGWQKEPTDKSRKIVVEIKRIYRASTFLELFDVIEKDTLRFTDRTDLLKELRSWWSEEKEVNTGTLAFYVSLIK